MTTTYVCACVRACAAAPLPQVLHLVDFDQLKIENQQYMERIEERNNELLKLKLSTSRTVQVGVGVRGSGFGGWGAKGVG